MENSKMKVVYVITKRGSRSFWSRIGVAFVNGDGSLNVKLESFPVNGELQIRDYVPREEHANTETFSSEGPLLASTHQAA